MTVTEYVPKVVPPVPVPPPPPLLPPPPPHPMSVTILTARRITPKIRRQLWLRLGIPKIRRQAKSGPPLPEKKSFGDLLVALVGAVVLIVSVAVLVAVPVMVTEAGIEQVGGMAAEVVILQLRVTTPVNPLDGVTEIVEVPLLPSVLIVIAPPLLSVKLGEVASQFPTTGASTTF